ncbi:MAG: hypothetical protein NNA23_10200 [Nitrospira sp.]|nr:hypothetical protein [Nitrospira sp.]MCP9463891.1 hypothetical protein [Nitrospira sp.]
MTAFDVWIFGRDCLASTSFLAQLLLRHWLVKSHVAGRSTVKIICAWCLQEGKVALLGEKMPFDDLRETHGICRAHQLALQVKWKQSLLAIADGAKQQPSRTLSTRFP